MYSRQILILLHPFIPFVTEEIWLNNKFDKSGKDFLMLANWPTGEINKDSSTEQVENIISIISEIRSFKNELNVSPGSFIDMSINNINDDQKDFINNNEIILKKLGRIKIFLTMIWINQQQLWLFQGIYLKFILIKMLI